MLEVPILKEIRDYETKLVGPLSFRGLICSGAAIIGAYGIYSIQKLMGIAEPEGFLCFLGALPGGAFMVIKPYGLKLEVYLKTAFIDTVMAPKKRPYCIENPYYELLKQCEEDNSYSDNEDANNLEIINTENTDNKKSKKNHTKNNKNKKLPPELTSYK